MITWQPCTVKLSDLRPWADNPRMSTKKQAQRLLDSWTRFGQVQAIAIGPDNEVYDGHQRLSALLTVHGNGYTVDARRCSRALSDEERRALVVTLHAGAVGSWDWDALSGWDAGELQQWGFDGDTLTNWQKDVTAWAPCSAQRLNSHPTILAHRLTRPMNCARSGAWRPGSCGSWASTG